MLLACVDFGLDETKQHPTRLHGQTQHARTHTHTHTHNNWNRGVFPKRVLLLEVLNSDRAGRLCGSGPQWPRAGAGVAIGVALPAPSGCSGVFILGCLGGALRLPLGCIAGCAAVAVEWPGCMAVTVGSARLAGVRLRVASWRCSGCYRPLGATIVFLSCACPSKR